LLSAAISRSGGEVSVGGVEGSFCVSANVSTVYKLSHLDGIALPELFVDWLIDNWH